MAMGRRKAQQQVMWVATTEIAMSPAHPFYRRVNELLAQARFDHYAEQMCRRFYAPRRGRPSLVPGVYFRLLMIGYFEGIESERGIAWRVADSLTLRDFLGLSLTEATPDHSTISRNRRLLPEETHRAMFRWVLKRLAEHGLLKGKTMGIDATTLEANAALKSIVRRDSGESYRDYLKGLAQAAGMEELTAAELARLDRKRKKRRTSNEEWKNRHDEEARITKMKDGRTHFAYKAEHAVDMETGAVTAVVVAAGDAGDTTTIEETLPEAGQNTADLVGQRAERGAVGPVEEVHREGIEEVVADKGYHSDAVLQRLADSGVRAYISEPDRGRRRWVGKRAEQERVYGNRRRIRGDYGEALLRKRGELLERGFAHCYDTGGMRRVWLRGKKNILKRALLQAAAFNLSLILRALVGAGTPRQYSAAGFAVLAALPTLFRVLRGREVPSRSESAHSANSTPHRQRCLAGRRKLNFTTGC
jgi:transposase